jgi:hypothetical protein
MTDLEMTKLCAEAMGWQYLGDIGTDHENSNGRPYCLSGGKDWWKSPEGETVCNHCYGRVPDPLHDDAQAMALVKKFGICLEPPMLPTMDWLAWKPLGSESDRSSNYKDLNRAIVECVAKMQERK